METRVGLFQRVRSERHAAASPGRSHETPSPIGDSQRNDAEPKEKERRGPRDSPNLKVPDNPTLAGGLLGDVIAEEITLSTD